MKSVFILGAGGFGREMAQWALGHPDCGVKWRIAGFLDDNPSALAGYACTPGVVGPIKDHAPDHDALYLCGLGLPAAKRAVCEPLVAAGAKFLTLTHPAAIIGARVQIGEGSLICPGAILSCDIVVGRFVIINLSATVGHDASIGDFTTLSAHADITGFVKIGSDVFVGSRAGVVPGKKVGAGALVGAGSTVISDVAPGVRVFGSPARPC